MFTHKCMMETFIFDFIIMNIFLKLFFLNPLLWHNKYY